MKKYVFFMFAIKVSGKVSRRLMGNKGKRTVPESPCWKLNVNYCKMCEDVQDVFRNCLDNSYICKL